MIWLLFSSVIIGCILVAVNDAAYRRGHRDGRRGSFDDGMAHERQKRSLVTEQALADARAEGYAKAEAEFDGQRQASYGLGVSAGRLERDSEGDGANPHNLHTVNNGLHIRGQVPPSTNGYIVQAVHRIPKGQPNAGRFVKGG